MQKGKCFLTLLEIDCKTYNMRPINSWKEMKNRLIHEYLPPYYKNRLIDKLEKRSPLNIRTHFSKCEEYIILPLNVPRLSILSLMNVDIMFRSVSRREYMDNMPTDHIDNSRLT